MNTPAFAAHLRKEEEHFRSLSIERADFLAKKILNQYAAIHAVALHSIVETGVAVFALPQLAVRREGPSLAETPVDHRRR